MRVLATLLIGAGLALPAAGHAGDLPDSASSAGAFAFGATYASRYLFQGIDYSQGQPVLQPEATASWRGVSLALWGNVDPAHREWNELDTTLRAAWERSHLSCGLAVAWLSYPNRPPDWIDSGEIVGDVTWSAWARSAAAIHLDVRGGAYAVASIERDIAVRGLSATLGPRLYAQRRYDGRTGISAVEARASLGGSWKRLSWAPSVSRTWTWANGNFRDSDAVPAAWLFAFTLSTE